MRHILLLILSVIGIFSTEAQSAQGRYASRMTQDGTIFFVMPQKLGTTEGVKSFDYDMTLLSWTDSVTVNFTFKSEQMGLPSNLEIIAGEHKFKCDDYSLLYMDIVKGGYEIRVTSHFPADQIKEMIYCETPPVFYFVEEGVECRATYKKAAWKKDRKKLIDIYQLYCYAK